MMDWTAAAADLLAIRNDNSVSITIRRGATTLAAQTVRIAGAGAASGQTVDPGGLQQAVGRVLVLGTTSLDIQAGDRFTASGNLYEVVLVQQNKRAAVVAEAKLVQ
jgi:LEA14-like dessication related protein